MDANPKIQETIAYIYSHQLGQFAHPIYLDGKYPKSMKSLIDEKSFNRGYLISRLPTITSQKAQLFRGTSDFFSLNFFTTVTASGKSINQNNYYHKDMNVDVSDKHQKKPSFSSIKVQFILSQQPYFTHSIRSGKCRQLQETSKDGDKKLREQVCNCDSQRFCRCRGKGRLQQGLLHSGK